MEIYDSHIDKRNFEIDGITGEIRQFIKEDVAYPYYVIETTPDNPVPLSRLQVLPQLFGTTVVSSNALSAISVYYKDGNKVVKLGKLAAGQVKSFLRLFAGNQITGMYDKDTVLTGDYLYVLSD